MNPINILNSDMSTFMMATSNLFDVWNDTVAEGFKNHYIHKIQEDWNAYLQEMNVRMKIFMLAEKTIDKEMSKYEKEYQRK